MDLEVYNMNMNACRSSCLYLPLPAVGCPRRLTAATIRGLQHLIHPGFNLPDNQLRLTPEPTYPLWTMTES